MRLPKHLMIAEDGKLFDTRKDHAVRANYQRTHSKISSVADLKATLRAGQHTFPGCYPLYFITADGGSLSFESVRENLGEIMGAMREDNDPQWRVIACEINYEDELYCDHSGKPIESAYGDTTNLDGMDVDELREFANDKTNNVILRRYAKMKAKAMECRLGGDIQAALQLESMADRIYQRLPEELKW